jgi:hypothetical protein
MRQMKENRGAGSEKNTRITVLSLLAGAGSVCMAVSLACGGSGNTVARPSPDEAFSKAKEYVSERLLIENWDIPPECQYEAPKWHRISVSEVGDGQYDVRGAVVSANFYCVIDVSYFSATVRFDESNQQWALLGEVVFSNPCVTTERAYLAEDCVISEWTPGWEPER